MINKPYLTVKHIIIELVSAGIALLNLIFVIVMLMVNHVDLLSELPQNADTFGSLESLLVIAVVFFIGTIVTIIANHFFPSAFYRLPFRVNPEKYNIVMYYVTLGTSINMLEVSVWVCILSMIWTFKVDILEVPSVILLLLVVVPTSLVFTIIAYRHNK